MAHLTPEAFYILGPTAVGKSSIAAEIAAATDAEVVGADAFQVYAGLDILTAKPSRELLARVPHHLIGEVPLTHAFDVGQYLDQSRRRIAEIRHRGHRVIIVGGTGMYVRALTHGLAKLPGADMALRAELEAQPLTELRARLAALDPLSIHQIDLQNRRRVIRALEVCTLTGHPFSSFREEWARQPAQVRGVILMRDREELYARINARAEEMFAAGVVEEVRHAAEIGPTASQAIGFTEIRDLLAGNISQNECIVRIQQATRRYAKRQLTWFRREQAFETINLSRASVAAHVIEVLSGRVRDW